MADTYDLAMQLFRVASEKQKIEKSQGKLKPEDEIQFTEASFNDFSQSLSREFSNLSPEEQTFYFGFYSVIIAGFFCIIKLDFKLSNILYCLYSLLNGFIFYICNFLNSVSFQNIEISKLQPVSYLSTVLVVIASAVIFKENLYFTDILGALMIIGFIIYNGMYPPKS